MSDEETTIVFEDLRTPSASSSNSGQGDKIKKLLVAIEQEYEQKVQLSYIKQEQQEASKYLVEELEGKVKILEEQVQGKDRLLADLQERYEKLLAPVSDLSNQLQEQQQLIGKLQLENGNLTTQNSVLNTKVRRHRKSFQGFGSIEGGFTSNEFVIRQEILEVQRELQVQNQQFQALEEENNNLRTKLTVFELQNGSDSSNTTEKKPMLNTEIDCWPLQLQELDRQNKELLNQVECLQAEKNNFVNDKESQDEKMRILMETNQKLKLALQKSLQGLKILKTDTSSANKNLNVSAIVRQLVQINPHQPLFTEPSGSPRMMPAGNETVTSRVTPGKRKPEESSVETDTEFFRKRIPWRSIPSNYVNCPVCGKTLTKTFVKRHIRKQHASYLEESAQVGSGSNDGSQQ